MKKDYIGFTVDLRMLVSVLSQDPLCKAEIEQGLAESNAPLTSSLGAANTGTADAPQWHTLFPASAEGVQSGTEGLFYRNSSKGGKGDRIQMRLKRQTSSYSQPRPAQKQYSISPTPGASMGTQAEIQAAAETLQKENPELFAKLLAQVESQQGAGQLSSTASTPTPTSPSLQESLGDPGPQIPDDITAMLNGAG